MEPANRFQCVTDVTVQKSVLQIVRSFGDICSYNDATASKTRSRYLL